MPRLAAGALILFLLPAIAPAATFVVRPGESIQAAADRAPAGSRILVRPGIYHEPGAMRAVTVTRDDIHLIGLARPNHPVIIEQAGTQTQGIWVSPSDTLEPVDVELPPCGVSGQRIRGSEVRGFTVQGFAGFGIYLACVDDFRIRRNVARNDLTYSIFPVRSRRGRMSGNQGSGTHADACIYVGQDDDVLVDHNRATDCLIGLQIENCQHVTMRDNQATGNTAGIIVDVINGRQAKVAADNRLIRNTVAGNNRPNNAPPEDDTSMIPPGIGIIVNGATRTLITRNTIRDDGLAGMTLEDFCLGMPAACADPALDIDPNPNDNRVIANRFDGNKVDVIFLPGQGTGNCFARNHPAELTGGPFPTCAR
jgi:nitrous oxidase accessory protein NosD